MANTRISASQTLLITGGTGSFGRRLAKLAIQNKLFKKVIIFSRDEWKQWEMKHSDPVFDSPHIRFFLGDIRDKERLQRAFTGVDVVVHAAALKQIVTAEYNPIEFIKTNVYGAMNLLEAATDTGVEKVLVLSTDKSVNPVNLYGATKLCQDKLTIAANNYVGKTGRPLCSVVRYGNVAGTRGSVIPYWNRLIQGGAKELPITDVQMTRFWITLDQAIAFVLHRLATMRGAEIFIPKLPSFYIRDLKEAMAPKAATKAIGIRPGEKLHELLISQDEARHTLEFKDYYCIFPEFSFRGDLPSYAELVHKKGKMLPQPFTYISSDNADWLNVSDLKKELQEITFF